MKLSTLPPISRRGKTVVGLVLQASLCGVGIICMFVPPAALPTAYTLSVAIALLLAWCIGSWKLAGRPIFDPYCIFLIAAFLFNAGHALLEVIDSNELGIMNGIFSDAVVKQTLLLSFNGLAALHFGALLTVAVSASRIGHLRWTVNDGELWARRLGWALLLVSVPAAAIWLTQTISVVAASGYASLYDRDFQAGIAATPFLLSGFLVPGAFLLTASGRTHRFDRRLAAGVILVFVVLQFYIGYRSTAAMPLIAWMWLQHKLIKPVRWSAIMAWAAVLVFLVFPLVRETRNMAADERSTESYWSTFTSVDNPAISSIAEMGSTMGTTAHTITLVPSSRPYDEGAGYAYGLLTIFPNLFWDIHPTIERGTANDWLVRAINPWLAARGGAYGYSCIAEAYLNFGQPGVPIIMCLYGILLVGLVLWAEKSGDISKIVLVATILAFSLRFPRDEIGGIVRAVVWYGVLPYIAMRLLPQVALGAIKTGRLSRPRRLRGAHS
jgi:oligosaccharide repeat unit polymerase